MSFANDKPFKTTRQETIIGVVIVLLVVFSVLFLLVTDDATESRSNNIPYYTTLTKSHGIAKGGTITMKGLVIGEVTSVRLNAEADIEVQFMLNEAYTSFYTEGSYVQPDDSLGIDTVLTGVGLVFYSAGKQQATLTPGTFITAQEPPSFNDSLAKLDIEQTISKVEAILTNLEQVTGSVASDRNNIQEIMDNTSQLTKSLLVTTDNVNKLLMRLESLSSKSEEFIAATNNNVTQNMAVLNDTMKEYQALASDLREITEQISPTMEASPKLAEDLELILFRTNLLMMKLNNHWLLNSDQEKDSGTDFRVPRSGTKPAGN